MEALMQYDGSTDEEEDEMDVQESSTVSGGNASANEKESVHFVTGTIIDDDVDSADGDNQATTSNLDNIEVRDFRNLTDLKLEIHLPQPKVKSSGSTFESDELSAIPPKKIYGDEEKPSDFVKFKSKKKPGSGVVQISIPSLKDFETDDDGQMRRKSFQGSQKASGLFALLPEPKNDFTFRRGPAEISTVFGTNCTPSTSEQRAPPTKTPTQFIPHAVKQASSAGKRPAPPNEHLDKLKAKYMKQEIIVQVVKNSSGKQKAEANDEEGDSEDEELNSSDFFSLDAKSKEALGVSNSEISSEFLILPQQPVATLNPYPAVEEYSDSIEVDEPLPTPFVHQVQPQQADLSKYLQPAKKGKGKTAEINIIDVNADDLRPQTTDWLKTITDTSIIPPRKAVLPGGMTRRKHQITYLAAEAKAREEELQNQWASNRSARRQTQNKYGF